jgi:hypothetical protein
MTLNVTTLKASFVSFGKIEADRAQVIRAIIANLGDPVTYETYEAARKLFGEVKREANPKVSDAAVNVAWGTFRTACESFATAEGFDFAWPEKPKATTPEAVKKAAQRAVPEAVEKAQSVAELDAIAKPADKVEAAKLEAQIAAKKLQLAKAETKQAEKAKGEALKARKTALIEFIKNCDVQTLVELEAMRDHDAVVILAALPALEVQKATAKLAALLAQNPAKQQKKTRAKLEPAKM